MIIGPDSPLLRLPREMDPEQLAFLEGVRFSIQMAGLSFDRLYAGLYEVSVSVQNARPHQTLFAAQIVTDAWSLVDSIQRLRVLCERFPLGPRTSGTNPRHQAITPFLRRTEVFLDLRNHVQHLEEKIDAITARRQTTWGTVSWFYWPSQASRNAFSLTLVPGAFVDGGEYLLPPREQGMPVYLPIDYVLLKAHGVTADLTVGIRAVERLASWFEQALAENVSLGADRTRDNLVIEDRTSLRPDALPSRTSPIAPSKLAIIEECLRAICPRDLVHGQYLGEEQTQAYRIQYGGRLSARHLVVVERAFLDANPDEAIRARVQSEGDFAAILRGHGKLIRLTSEGLAVEVLPRQRPEELKEQLP